MTSPLNTKDTVDEILREAFMGHWVNDSEGNFVRLDDKHSVLRNDLKQQLKAIISEIIGEDEPLETYHAKRRNMQRAEQRAKLKELLS